MAAIRLGCWACMLSLTLLTLPACSTAVLHPSPTVYQLEQGDTWISPTLTTDDASIYGVAYVVNASIASTWDATDRVVDWWATSSDAITAIEDCGRDHDGSRRLKITWRNGTEQEVRCRRNPVAHRIYLDFMADRPALGQIATCSIRLRPFLPNSTLVEAEITIRSSFMKRLVEVLLPPVGVVGLVQAAALDAELRRLWTDASEVHRTEATLKRPVPLTGRVHLLVIGIDTERQDATDWGEVNLAEEDAQTFYDWAESVFPTVADAGAPMIRKKLLGAAATSRAIGRVLQDLTNTEYIMGGDVILFFFAGHMLRERQTHKPDADKIPYLMTADAEKHNLSFTAIAKEEILTYLGASPAGRCVVFFDACDSGGWRVPALPLGPPRIRSRGNSPPSAMTAAKSDLSERTALFSAAGPLQDAIEMPELGHGILTHVLLNGLGKKLADEDEDGCITFGELASYVTTNVTDISEARQNPVIHLPGGFGDTPFVPIECGRRPSDNETSPSA